MGLPAPKKLCSVPQQLPTCPCWEGAGPVSGVLNGHLLEALLGCRLRVVSSHGFHITILLFPSGPSSRLSHPLRILRAPQGLLTPLQV